MVVFSSPVEVHQSNPDLPTEYRTECKGSDTSTFQQWMTDSSREQVVEFWRLVIEHLEKTLKLQSFRICVRNGWDNRSRKALKYWNLEVLYHVNIQVIEQVDEDANSLQKKVLGPVIASECMSCDLEASLAKGIMGDEEAEAISSSDALEMKSRDTLLKEEDGCRVWIDAKGRPMLIVTPTKHVERINQMSDDEVYALMQTVVRWLDKFKILDGFSGLVINHGLNRTHEHLHAKIKINFHAWKNAVRLDKGLKEKFEAIERWAQKTLPEHRKGDRNAWIKRMRDAKNKSHETQDRKRNRTN
jgi:diadenosine tetraphosphate (Ap4A) HIT family hydrolase